MNILQYLKVKFDCNYLYGLAEVNMNLSPNPFFQLKFIPKLSSYRFLGVYVAILADIQVAHGKCNMVIC